jgi:hypothetical protein
MDRFNKVVKTNCRQWSRNSYDGEYEVPNIALAASISRAPVGRPVGEQNIPTSVGGKPAVTLPAPQIRFPLCLTASNPGNGILRPALAQCNNATGTARLPMEIVRGTPAADAFDPLVVMPACVHWHPKVAARERRLLAGGGNGYTCRAHRRKDQLLSLLEFELTRWPGPARRAHCNGVSLIQIRRQTMSQSGQQHPKGSLPFRVERDNLNSWRQLRRGEPANA